MSKLRGVTAYQMEILEAVRSHAAAGAEIDLDQMLDTLSWKPTKQSLQFSIRALIAKRMIQKTGFQVRRGRKRVCFNLDVEGLAVFDPRLASAPPPVPAQPAAAVPAVPVEIPEPELSDDLLAGLEVIEPEVSFDG